MFKNWKAEISIIIVLFVLAFVCLLIYEVFKDRLTTFDSAEQTTFVVNYSKAQNADSVSILVNDQLFHLEKNAKKWTQSFNAKKVKAISPIKIVIHKGDNENRIKVPDLKCIKCQGTHQYTEKKGNLSYKFVPSE